MSVSTVEIKELVDATRVLHTELMQRVEESDKERKSAHESLTSQTAKMFGEATATIERINAEFAKLQEKYDKLELERKEAQLAANRPPFHGLDFAGKKQRSDAHNAWMKAIKTRDNGLHLTQEEKSLIIPAYMPNERKALYAADATTGGYFAATDFLDELLAYRLLISPMRSICRIQGTSGEKVQMPSLANDTTVFWAAEQAAFQNSQDPTTSMVEIPVHEIRALLKISQQNLEDSQFNLEDFMKQRMMKGFAKKEGQAFVAGTGNGQPQGIMSFPFKATTTYSGGSAGKNNVTDAIPYVLSGATAGNIIQEDVTNVLMDLKADYDNSSTAYILTRGTLNTIRLFKDSIGRPLWIPFGADVPSTINNRRYVEMPDMPEIASGAYPLAVGDFSNYMIVDRVNLAIRELDELFAVSGLVGFIARMRVGGQCLLPEAFRVLKIN
jgi:HK97 family phage major capsid protein